MARNRHDSGHAADRTALPAIEFAPQPHRRKRTDDRLRKNVPHQLPHPAFRPIPERCHPRRDGAVMSLASLVDKKRRKSENSADGSTSETFITERSPKPDSGRQKLTTARV